MIETGSSMIPYLLLAGMTLIGLTLAMVSLSAFYRSATNRLPAAALYTDLEGRLSSRREELADVSTRLEEAHKHLLEREKAEAEAHFYQDQIDKLKAEKESMSDVQEDIEAMQEQVRAALEEYADAKRQRDEMREVVEELTLRNEAEDRRCTELTSKAEELERTIEEVRARLAEVEQDEEEIKKAKQELEEAYRSLDSARSEAARLEGSAAIVEERVDEKRAELTKVQADLENLEDENSKLEKIRENMKLGLYTLSEIEQKAARAQANLAELEAKLGKAGAGDSEEKLELQLSDLKVAPSCLDFPAHNARQFNRTEEDAIHGLENHLRNNDLEFSDRVVRAFHTSLKINQISPISILAGVSGTGKSQLPRRYAEGMGIHFLQVPVQPRWDSPQDLIGFYNYIESRYRATDLARAMVHMDGYNWPEESAATQDRMLLVLLDEMNLARVEYYFSEFLSRLEMRPDPDQADNEAFRSSSEIAIDLQATEDSETHKIYPGHNLLFVGTMNEDESTLALSDKVLDRSNVMRFSRPDTLFTQTDHDQAEPPTEYLSRETWQSWQRSYQSIKGTGVGTKAEQVVQDLNNMMAGFNRPFGHRLGQSMLAYVANYPAPETAPPDNALVDQIEMRILPKLRGLDVEATASQFGQLEDLVRNQLHDSNLAEAISKSREAAEQTGGLFSWLGRGGG